MEVPERSILLVAGRLGIHDEGWSVGPFIDRLQRLGYSTQMVCVEATGDAAHNPRVVECPGLAHRWRLPLAVRSLRFGERLNRPNLVHVLSRAMSEAGLAIAEHWGVPYVQTVDEFVPPGGTLRLSRKWCRRLIATSRELADDLSEKLAIPADLVSMVNPGIEAPEEDPVRPPRGKVAVIGTAGPLVMASGFATFLNAARRILDAGLDAEFVIAGQGEDEVDLRRRAARLKIADRVTFAGIPQAGLRFWNVLDVFCQPTLIPSVGRTLATALAFGVPSVASDIEGLRALIVQDENGLRVAPGDSAALSGRVLELLADPDRAQRLGREGRRMILRDYRPDDEAQRLALAYQEAMDESFASFDANRSGETAGLGGRRASRVRAGS